MNGTPVAPVAEIPAPPLRSRKGNPTCRAVTPDDVLFWPAILTQTLYTQGEVERFLAKIDIGGPDDCWPWTGALSGRELDRGLLGREGGKRNVYAARMTCELKDGRPLGRNYACHTCDNPPCCNPGHVFPATQRVNIQDCASKGRWGKTRRTPSVDRFDPIGRAARREARVIRNAQILARRESGASIASIADEFGLSIAAVSVIVRGGWSRKDVAA